MCRNFRSSVADLVSILVLLFTLLSLFGDKTYKLQKDNPVSRASKTNCCTNKAPNTNSFTRTIVLKVLFSILRACHLSRRLLSILLANHPHSATMYIDTLFAKYCLYDCVDIIVSHCGYSLLKKSELCELTI